jgi:interferon-induced transmembrane protein
MSQPWNPPPPPGAPPPNNNLAIAIVATVVSVVFCCIPHGLVSLIFAMQVNNKAAAGDMAGALNAARQAKMWGLISIAVAVIGLVLGIVLGVLNALISTMGRV